MYICTMPLIISAFLQQIVAFLISLKLNSAGIYPIGTL
jgi:hypothetical protein